MRKTTLLAHYSCSMQKTAKKTGKNGVKRPFWKFAKMAAKQSYSLCKKVSLAQILKMLKRCEKRLY